MGVSSCSLVFPCLSRLLFAGFAASREARLSAPDKARVSPQGVYSRREVKHRLHRFTQRNRLQGDPPVAHTDPSCHRVNPRLFSSLRE